MGDDGVRRIIPCRKSEFVPVMHTMIERRREFLLGSGDLPNYRMWTALAPCVMHALPSVRLPALPSSVEEFISAYRFSSPRGGEEHQGATPLMLCAMSGNLAVLNGLISQHEVDMEARLQIDMFQFGIQKGTTALVLSASLCPQNDVRTVVAALLAAGVNPNVTNQLGTTPLMAAAVYQSREGVKSLLACAGDTLDLEKKLKGNRATALSVAAFVSTAEIVDALVQAGADQNHIEDGGGSKLADACSNPAADMRMLEVLCRPSDGDRSLRNNINDRMKPRTVKSKLIDLTCRNMLRAGQPTGAP